MMAGDMQRCDLLFLGKAENEVYQLGPQQETDDMVKLDNLRF